MEMVDLALLALGEERMPVWACQTEDLNVNLLVLARDGRIEEHRNAEVDVLVVGVQGEGSVSIEGEAHALRAGQAIVIPKGTLRSFRAIGERFAYLTCHRRRGRLWPDALSGRQSEQEE